MVTGPGQVMLGRVVSCTVITCRQLLELLQLSTAVQVLLMIKLPGHVPGTVTSLKVILVTISVQLSVAVARPPVLAGVGAT